MDLISSVSHLVCYEAFQVLYNDTVNIHKSQMLMSCGKYGDK